MVEEVNVSEDLNARPQRAAVPRRGTKTMPETGRVAAGVRERGMQQETDAKRGRPMPFPMGMRIDETGEEQMRAWESDRFIVV